MWTRAQWTGLFWFVVRRNRRKCVVVYDAVRTNLLQWSVLLTLVLSFAGTCFAQAPTNGDTRLIRMAEKQNSGASPVKNIRVEAIYIDDPDNHVKLNVSWDPPTEGTMPSGYGVKQIPLNATGHCDHHGGYETFGVSSEQTSELINEYVIPGCSYRIEVISQPDNDVDLPYLIYNVPDCVGRKCSCKDMTFMPALEARAKQISEHTVRVVWKIPAFSNWTNLYNLTKVRIYINAHSTFMSKMVYERAVSNADANRTQVEDIKIPDIIPGGFYKFEVFLENNHFCTTKGAALQLQIQFVQDWMVTVMIPLLFFIMFTGFIIVLMWKKRCCWSVRKCWLSQPQARRIYRPVCAEGYRGRHHFTIPMEYNSLYIKDKEILEERERGKADRYEVCYTRLKIGSKIGGGAFGQVFRAKATAIAGFPGVITVAVKKLKKTATPEELEEFLLEIGMLKQIGQHPNIVTMLGCCTIRQPYCMIMEYVPCGDLLHYLRALRVQYEQKGKSFLFTVNKNFDVSPGQDTQKLSDCSYITPESLPSNRLPSVTETEYTMLSSEGVPLTPITPQPDSPGVLECVLDPKELQSFSLQIAKGMKYLEKKQIVHRDLAARNILITENKTLKISDFGLSRRGIYVNTKHKRVPLRWLSIEAIRDNLYTSKSDVWAYGIVLWEIGTLGGFPYPTVANGEILNFLLAGKRLEKPENCTDELYSLMQKCWAHSEDQRPSFTDLVKYLESISNRKRVYVDFSQLNPSYIFPPTEEQTTTTTETTKTEDTVKTVEIVLTTTR